MKAGQVIKISFFIILKKKKRKVCNFIGFCVFSNKKKRTFSLQNYYNSEFINYTLSLDSPNILNYYPLPSYNFKTRLSKLYYFKNIYLYNKTDKLLFPTKISSLDPLFFLFPPKYIYVKEKKKLRNKFRI